jgi:hypothetical protein
MFSEEFGEEKVKSDFAQSAAVSKVDLGCFVTFVASILVVLSKLVVSVLRSATRLPLTCGSPVGCSRCVPKSCATH